MSWKDLTISKKLATGFGAITILTIMLSFLSLSGISRIVSNANEVIDANSIRPESVTYSPA